MAFAVVTKLFQVTMHFKGAVGGWSEKLFLNSGSVDTLKATAKSICDYRLAILPDTLQLKWAKLSQLGSPRDRRMLNYSFPVDGTWPGLLTGTPPVATAGTNTVNSLKDCVILAFETDDGNWANRYVHGIPDAEIADEDLVNTLTVAGTAPPPIGDSGFSAVWATRFGYYMYQIKNLTVMGSDAVKSGKVVYYSSSIDALNSRGLTQRKVGRFFGQPVGRARPR